MIFQLYYLQITQKSVSLYCVFHSIRFKVNKGWSTAVLLFLFIAVSFCRYFWIHLYPGSDLYPDIFLIKPAFEYHIIASISLLEDKCHKNDT